MKIDIGPYRSWIGPYQIAEKILFWRDKDEDDSVHKLGEWLNNTFLKRVCEWIHEKKKRKIKIRIDPYDTWSMDDTLALIILPLLKQLRASKHGSGLVDDEDVPEELRSTAAAPPEDYDTYDNWYKRWEWVLDEMIWAFEQIADPENDNMFFKNNVLDKEGYTLHNERINRGTTFFGKYYRGLWD